MASKLVITQEAPMTLDDIRKQVVGKRICQMGKYWKEVQWNSFFNQWMEVKSIDCEGEFNKKDFDSNEFVISGILHSKQHNGEEVYFHIKATPLLALIGQGSAYIYEGPEVKKLFIQ